MYLLNSTWQLLNPAAISNTKAFLEQQERDVKTHKPQEVLAFSMPTLESTMQQDSRPVPFFNLGMVNNVCSNT